MGLDFTILKEIPFPEEMTPELAERWADIPRFSEDDPRDPEWRATTTHEVDLMDEGYGVVYVKDESDTRSNPTGTVKDRAMWEVATDHRDFGQRLSRRWEKVLVPRFTYVTEGNMCMSASDRFRRHGLPPLKVLVDCRIDERRLKTILSAHADVYMADLHERALSPEDINRMTNNVGGINLASTVLLEGHARWYDWQVHETFNENPDLIFVPYGSGQLFECYLVHQMRNARKKDPRLQISQEDLARMSVLGAQPMITRSIANKLGAPHNPFVLFDAHDMRIPFLLRAGGKNTGVYQITEASIKRAYDIMTKHFATEPSASAGLALYMQLFEAGSIDPRHKILIVNTGKGI